MVETPSGKYAGEPERQPDIDGPGKIFIGVAWPYANGHLHLGHVAGSLLAPDIFSRFQRMRGRRVLMVSGSDEHGTPVTVTAEEEGVSPEEVSDRYHRATLESLRGLGIEFDLFTRTHTPNHTVVVQDMFLALMNKGYIEKRITKALYCSHCKKFLPDRYVEGECPLCGSRSARGDQCDECGKPLDAAELVNSMCKLCGAAPGVRETEHFFLLLSRFRDRLLDYISGKVHWRKNVKKFTENWLREGLKDRAITRDMTWGVPIPLEGYDDKRIYVWFDAVTGYLAASKEWAQRKSGGGGGEGGGSKGGGGSDGTEGGYGIDGRNPDAWKDFWYDPACRHYYFLGKDNIPFHTIIWPSMLMGYGGLNLPYDVPANEYLRFEGGKFSKSRGVGVYIKDFLEKYDADACRYYLSYNMPEQRDADFSEEEFVAATNNELVANFGNFIHRMLTFTARNFGEIPPVSMEKGCEALEAPDVRILDRTRETFERVTVHIERCDFKAGIREIMALSKEANRYFNERAPWKLIKENRDACGTTLHIGLKVAKALTVMIYPYMPHAAVVLWGALGEGSEKDLRARGWNAALEPLEPGRRLEMPEPVFRKLEKLEPVGEDGESAGTMERSSESRLAEGRKGAAQQQRDGGEGRKTGKKKKKKKQVEPIALPDVELKVAFIEEIWEHPDAEKLYILKIDCGGGEKRQLVAGLRPYYDKEEMRGRKIIVVANLQPAKLRGVESRGMLLAAESGGRISFLTPVDGDVEPGTIVTGCGDEPAAVPAEAAPTTGKDRTGKEQIDIMQFATLRMLIGEVVSSDGENVVLDIGETTVEMPVCPSCAALKVGERAVVVLPSGGERGQEKAAVLTAGGSLVVPEREIGVGARIR